LGAFERIYEHLQAADALAQTLADAGRQGWIAAYLSAHCFNSGALEQALENGRQALAFAQSCGDAALKTVGTYFVGLAALSRGRYAEAITMLGDRLDELTQGRSDESFGLPGPAAILARAWVTWGLAEQGAFAEGLRRGTAGLRLAEAAPHPFALASVAEGLGVVYLRQGAMSQAIAMFERGLQLCREWRLPLRVSSLTAFLGYTYALTGRTADALLLLEEAVAQAAVMQRQVYQALWMAFLSETQLQADRWEVAAQLAEQALALARTQQEAGTEAWVLRLCGDIAARRVPFAPAPAEAWYRQALHLADDLGMRPLQAHCHLGLGLLYHQHGAQPRAQSELVHARELLRSLEMTFWLPRVETVLGTLGGTEDISSRQWTDTQ
jgi:tetratricopeptide (TPR) repeat protein